MDETLGPADLQEMMDRHALENGLLGDGLPPDAGEEAVQELRAKLCEAITKLLQLRMSDPKGFDVMALKTLCPDMTYADMTEVLRELGRVTWTSRSRCYTKLQDILEHYPELRHVILLDNRGGKRDVTVSGLQLAREYEQLKRTEAAKPADEQRARLGVDGLLHELAVRHKINGLFGKPSWSAVRQRIWRAQRRVTKGGER